jgi:hypothetical protein
MRFFAIVMGLALLCGAPQGAYAAKLGENPTQNQGAPNPFVPGTPPDTRMGSFPLPGASFNVPLPDGYCLPTPSYEAQFKLMAAADPANLTDISYVFCADEITGANMSTWGMIKTPLQTLQSNPGTRHDLIAQLKGAVHSDEMQKLLTFNTDDPATKDKTNLTAVFGPDIRGAAKFDELDYDDNGVYFGGTVTYTSTSSDASYTSAGAYGVTIVNGRAFIIYVFKKYEDVRDIATVLAKVKAETSAFIAANGG